ncbi:polysaccharide biosynthesis protein [Aurantivibrio plasticivorans]
MLGRLFEAPRVAKRIISLTYDASALFIAFYMANCLRLGELGIPLGFKELASALLTISVSLIVFTRLGLYRAILRFMAQQALISVGVGVVISAITLATTSYFLEASIPRSVPIIYGFAALFFIGTPRLLVRNVVLMLKSVRNPTQESVIIYGAGHSGFQLASALTGTKYKVVAFVDDNKRLHGKLFRGLTVFKPKRLERLAKEHGISHILLALGNAPRSKRAAILNKLEPLGISIKTMPDTHDVLSGKSKIEDIKDVDVEDLLGRDPVKPDPKLLDACVKGKNVLVTGAGGSIGSELCRQILQLAPKKIVLFELSEYSLYKIEQEILELQKNTAHYSEIIGLIGSVQNREHLDQVFETFDIHTVYHAAAYKHVPLIEQNIIEGIKNNIFGTWNCAESAIATGVESFVLISTDKAVRPTNVMGASKRVSELVLQALSYRQSKTRFTMVRFGNVLGSSGSVVPLFRKQIKAGGPITVTHKEITRYFMTIPEAAELVIQAGSLGEGGDVFVLDMGESVKIKDLAIRMVHLSGLNVKSDEDPTGDIEIQYTGLRPGEKLYEELLIGDKVSGTPHPRIMRAEEKMLSWSETQSLLEELRIACQERQCEAAKELLLKAPTDFKTASDIRDWVWNYRTTTKTNLHII